MCTDAQLMARNSEVDDSAKLKQKISDVLSADSIQDGSADVGRHAVEAHVEELKFSSWASPQWASPQKVAKASAPLISCTEE